jgi:hypothetical protein
MLRLLSLIVVTASLLLGTPSRALAKEPLPATVAVVASLYRNYAWEAVIDEPGDVGIGLFQQTASELARYFDPALTNLITKDRECAVRARGMCRLDFLPIWDSQDPIGATVKITKGASPNEVSVALLHPAGPTREPLTYVLTKTSAGWRIADIRFGSNQPPLKALLLAPLPR